MFNMGMRKETHSNISHFLLPFEKMVLDHPIPLIFYSIKLLLKNIIKAPV